jgi:DNA-binding NarL/FixJ family response regulator
MARKAVKQPKVLIVDDDPGVRGLVCAILYGHAYVIECGDGSRAVEAFEMHRPDCVLMDLQMPGTSGVKITRDIMAVHPDARIVVLTQHDSAVLRAAAASAGASGYLLKDDLTDLPRVITPPR